MNHWLDFKETSKLTSRWTSKIDKLLKETQVKMEDTDNLP